MWADNYIFAQIDQYFDVSSMQSQFVKNAVKEDINKIEEKIFPRLVQELDEIKTILEGKTFVTTEMVFSYHTKFKKIFFSALNVFEPNAQKFVKKLNDSQLELFKVEFTKKLKELQKDLANPADTKNKRFVKVKGEFEIWLGFLTDTQKQDIQNFIDGNPFPTREQIQNREKLSAEFLESIKLADEGKKFIKKLFTDYESLREPRYAISLQAYQKKYFELIATVLNKLTLSQKNHVIEILTERADHLRTTPPLKKAAQQSPATRKSSG